MKVKCIHCFEIVELDPNADLAGIICPSCGGRFEIPFDETLDSDHPHVSSSHLESLQGGMELAGFSLVRNLFKGCRSDVWKAVEIEQGRTVALKVSHYEEQESDRIGHYSREAEILSKLNHSNIVSLSSHGIANRRSYLATDYIEGQPLSRWLVNRAPSPWQAAEITMRIADAMDHAHRQDVIHRDLSCQNVLMDERSIPHVIDFGLASMGMDHAIDGAQLTVGTPIYMAPEQIRGQPEQIDHRVDIYAIGVIFYELLTAKKPFEPGPNLIQRLFEGPIRTPRDIAPSISPDLSSICVRCLQKDASDRYSTARELVDSIQSVLGDQRGASIQPTGLDEVESFEHSRAYVALHSRCVDLEQMLERRTRALLATKTEYDVYRNLVESRSLGAFRKDLDDRIVFANEYFCQFVGRPRSEVVGRRVREILDHQAAAMWEAADNKILTTGSVYESTEQYQVGDRTLVFDVARSPVRNMSGRTVGIQGIMYDVSAHAEMEQALRDEKEVAVAANLAKGEFLARMSHEIRTPMTAIMGMNQVLATTPLTDKQLECTRAIADASQSLLEVINDILDFSKIDAGKIELEPAEFCLVETCDKVVKMLREEARQKEVQLAALFSSDIPKRLIGDAARLRRVLVNLIGNAIKFTSQGSVELRVRCEDAFPDRCVLRFEVADTGIGIPKNQLERIFQPFEQADSSLSRDQSGTGLGLAIASKIVELMGGSLAVTSRVGEGSRFYFDATFPTISEPKESVSTEGKPLADQQRDTVPLKPLRVLVVDDVEPNRLTLQHLLEDRGHSVVTVASGGDALRAIEQERFDVILMDIQLPGMDGFEATRRIRESLANTQHRTPIVALTAHAMKDSREWCLTKGMDGYASKPVVWSALCQELQRVLIESGDHEPPLFSLTEFQNRVGVDQASACQLISSFLACVPGLIESVVDSAQQNDSAGLREAVHCLKGAVENLVGTGGIPELLALKSMAERGDIEKADDVILDLEKTVLRLKNELLAYSTGQIE
ncbi:protein kinase [Stieleria sp. ICT_E10.1]|uniref:protein kinase domain-containing protein n=1 Tax=Stieleria sedimenti TaxID=2976331 RepID=UPI00217F28E0|nr:protein kinase [Stieleria sedimenti]MCS7466919.1 protein kinase [Stieleria sedimenti]